jgi:hypothetical protein
VAVDNGGALAVGSYAATLYVGDDPENRTVVAVEVLVGRPLWVLILTVGLGVLATELWLWWRERASFRLSWWARRRRWLDWLPEDLGWTRPYRVGDGNGESCGGVDDAERPALARSISMRSLGSMRAETSTIEDAG